MMGLIFRFGIMLTACFFVSSCATGKKTLPTDELKTSHNLSIIPYKARPVNVVTNVNPLAVGFMGTVGVLIQESATADARGKTAEYLNKAGGAWNPSLATAEECLNLLKNESKIVVKSSSTVDTCELEGTETLRKEEPRTFVETGNVYAWNPIWYNFKDTNASLINYRNKHPEFKPDWTLEVFCNYIAYNHSYIHLGVTVKLSDSNNNIIASGFNFNKNEIPNLQESFNFKTFDQAFRTVAQKSCATVLGEMGLY
jgi:hypothetical protein